MRTRGPIHRLIMEAAYREGVNATRLAEATGVTTSTAARWMKGHSEPGFQYWAAIEQALNLPKDALIEAKQASLEPQDPTADDPSMSAESIKSMFQELLNRLDKQDQMIKELKAQGS